MDDILDCHRAATVPAVRDTTMLDFSGPERSTGGLAKLGGGSGSRGTPAHVTLAMSASGRLLAVLNINADFRTGDTVKADRRRKRTGKAASAADELDEAAAEESESARGMDSLRLAQRIGRTSPNTRVISVCDRERDIREIFTAQALEAAGLLVRACRSNRRSVVDDGLSGTRRPPEAGGLTTNANGDLHAQQVVGRSTEFTRRPTP